MYNKLIIEFKSLEGVSIGVTTEKGRCLVTVTQGTRKASRHKQSKTKPLSQAHGPTTESYLRYAHRTEWMCAYVYTPKRTLQVVYMKVRTYKQTNIISYFRLVFLHPQVPIGQHCQPLFLSFSSLLSSQDWLTKEK